MFCSSCGAEISDQATICPKCGVSPSTKASPNAGQGMNSFVAASGAKVPDYLVWSIVSTFCCCAPAGIGAIIFSLRARQQQKANDIANAQTSAKYALWFIVAAVALGVVFSLICVLIQLCMEGME